MLPDFIIIGAMKSGTTSLHHYLNCHPDVFMASQAHIKELHFFVEEKNYHKGIHWYQEQFSQSAAVCGEASPSYTKYPHYAGVPERIHAVLPDVKLVYLLRDPVERILAHYIHNYAAGREQYSLPEAISTFEDNHYVICSQYFRQLARYWKYYVPERILILTSEELKHERRLTLQKIFRFLGVDDGFYCLEYEMLHHQSSQKGRRSKIHRYFFQHPTLHKFLPFVPASILKVYGNITTQAFMRPTLAQDLEHRLIEYLRHDVEALRRSTGNHFDSWRAY